MGLVLPMIILCVQWGVIYSTVRRWEDLHKRSLPHWYHEAKIGILVHWGIYSVPAYGPRSAPETKMLWKNWMQANPDIINYMRSNFGRLEIYEDLVKRFKAKRFDPLEWIRIFKAAGAKYVILTAKDCDGFTLYPSKYSPGWNSGEAGPKRDLVKALKKAASLEGLHFGVYYSLTEWFNTLYLDDLTNNYETNDYVLRKMKPELEQLVLDYKPKIIWADNGNKLKEKYFNSTDFLTWLYKDSPVGEVVVVNDRWNKGTRQIHGDFFTVPASNRGSWRKNKTPQSNLFNPRVLNTHKWEHQIQLDKKSLGFRKLADDAEDITTSSELIRTIVTTVSCGGNVLINLGARSDGTIAAIFKNTLEELGEWLEVNGEAIYGTTPWQRQNDTNDKVWYTCKTNRYDGRNPVAVPWQPDVYVIYAIFLEWPFKDNILKWKYVLKFLRSGLYKIHFLSSRGSIGLTWNITGNAAAIKLPQRTGDTAWTLRFTKMEESKIHHHIMY